MSTSIIVLRLAPLLAFAVPMMLPMTARARGRQARPRQRGRDRAPFVANLATLGAYCLALLMWSGSAAGNRALLLASSGALLGVAGAVLVLRSRTELGAAWSFVPQADRGIGFVSTGPYRVIRHPIYLGFLLLASGEAIAFGSWPALLIVLCGMVPTFVWRARVEERLLSRTFGERYAIYVGRTRMIVPYLL